MHISKLVIVMHANSIRARPPVRLLRRLVVVLLLLLLYLRCAALALVVQPFVLGFDLCFAVVRFAAAASSEIINVNIGKNIEKSSYTDKKLRN